MYCSEFVLGKNQYTYRHVYNTEAIERFLQKNKFFKMKLYHSAIQISSWLKLINPKKKLPYGSAAESSVVTSIYDTRFVYKI